MPFVPLLYCATLVVSAGLMFAVEPMFAKMVLCLLGGSPSVWNTCLVFYQAALMAGYVYAHVSVKWLGPRRQAMLHMAVLCLPWLVLPIAVKHGWSPQGGESPVAWLLKLLILAVGLPFLSVAASAPVLQAWYAARGGQSARDPYFLYAASNLGSLLGLAAYPLVIEPRWTLMQQSRGWAVGYGVLMLLFAACAIALWRSRPGWHDPELAKGVAAQEPRPSQAQGRATQIERPNSSLEMVALETDRPITWRRRLMWFVLSLVPSALLMGVTTHMSVDISPYPLLWAIPLGLYLLSFIFVFARWRLLEKLPLIRAVQAGLLALTAALFYVGGGTTPSVLAMAALHLAAFFVTALVCHGEMAADRPASRDLTEFYLWMSAGGVAGGLLCALVAPVVFNRVIEYPLMLVAACLLRPSFTLGRLERIWRKLDVPCLLILTALLAYAALVLQGGRLADFAQSVKHSAENGLAQRLALDRAADWLNGQYGKGLLVGLAAVFALMLQRQRPMFAVGISTVLVIGAICSTKADTVCRARSFFGVLRVDQSTYERDGKQLHCYKLVHGSTSHGAQSLDQDDARDPWTYYHRTGPVGDAFAMLQKRDDFASRGRIGVVGLGAGSTAAYGQPGQHITYFEIDPEVLKIAANPDYFTYLSNCHARWDVSLGDARLTLGEQPDGQFDVLFIDAFSSDAIPVHLLTREAVELYFRKLAEHGVLMVHVSNRHLRLQPVLARAGEGRAMRDRVDFDQTPPGKSASEWVMMARRESDLGRIAKDNRWKPLEVDPDVPLWTDDYSSIVGAMKWDWLPWRKK